MVVKVPNSPQTQQFREIAGQVAARVSTLNFFAAQGGLQSMKIVTSR